MRVADEVLPEHGQQRGVAHHLGQLPGTLDGRAGLLDGGLERGDRIVQRVVERQPDPDLVPPADAGEGQQVVDQPLHPLGAVHGEVDVLPAAVVELVGVALLQELAERRDLAQRLLQVVRGDVGELLELGVGAQQLRRLGVQVGGLPGGDFLGQAGVVQRRDQLAAHRLDVGGHRPQVGRAGHLDAVAEVAAHHAPGGRAQAGQRLDDGAVQHQHQRRRGEQEAPPRRPRTSSCRSCGCGARWRCRAPRPQRRSAFCAANSTRRWSKEALLRSSRARSLPPSGPRRARAISGIA